MKKLSVLVLVLNFACGFLVSARAEEPKRTFPSGPAPATPLVEWDKKVLFAAPKVYPAEGIGELVERDGIRPIFYDGVPFDGKPTRTFAWLGMPKMKPGEKRPAMVLVHGGGGTAYWWWVKLWTDRGYVAIAMDTVGLMPMSMDVTSEVKRERHPFSAVIGSGDWERASGPIDQQWGYHAVAAVALADSLLRSLPEVDADRIGLTGISWGGILVELAAAVDDRFRFVAPVYGSGFLGENSYFLETDFQNRPAELVQRWLDLWDPSQYAGRIKMPALFCNGTNDKHFRPNCWQKTHDLVKGPVTLSMKLRMGHGHPPSGDPKEIAVFADSILQGKPPLAKITQRDLKNGTASISWEAKVPVKKAELLYTKDSGADWVNRLWETAPAEVSGSSAKVKVPDGATAFFINTEDERGCIVSSEIWMTP